MTEKKPKNNKNGNKKKQDTKNTKNVKKAHVNKNCFVYMCDRNAKMSDGKTEAQVMKELEEIFMNSTSKYQMIGDPSQNGFALIVNGYREKRIVIKIPRMTNGTVDSLKYEYVMGCHIRKTLCKLIPNFMKVCGYIHKNDNEYLILERILPGTTLRDLTKENPQPAFTTLTSDVFLSVVLQVLCAVQVAQTLIGFVHYDLHFGNIVIKKDPKAPKVIVYEYIDRFRDLHTVRVPVHDGIIAVIIDYGRTHTTRSLSFFNKNPECFKPYKFLLDKKRLPNIVDIRQFDPVYDVKRFCRILECYLDKPHEFSFEYYDGMEEPHDVIVPLIKNYTNNKNKISIN